MDFDAAGRWYAKGAARLAELSEDIDVDKVGTEINSIPDMWARPLLFEMAFYDDHHLLYERVHGEWRGLMAMLALKEFASLSRLTIEEVTIPAPSTGANRGTNRDVPDFLRSLAELAPGKTVDSKTSWHQLYLFLYDNRPIGMTSPTTLVATATDYYGGIDANVVPWFNGRFLTDPTGEVHRRKHPREPFENNLSDFQRGALAKWLTELNNNLKTHQSFLKTSKEGAALLGVVRDFLTDVGAPGKYELDGNLGMTKGIFRLLDIPVAPGAGAESHVLLVSSRRGKQEAAKEDAATAADEEPAATTESGSTSAATTYNPPQILVVDEKIAEQWGVEKRQVQVWNTTTLQSIPYGGLPAKAPADKHVLPDGGRVTDVEVWSPRWFFKDTLYVIGKENAFTSAANVSTTSGGRSLSYNNGQLVTPIMPLDKMLVDQLTVKDLTSRVSFEQRAEGIQVKLRLPLSGLESGGRRMREVEFSRLYRFAQGEIKLIENVPVLAVWPNFRATQWGWEAYYTYYDRTGVTEAFDVKPYVPGVKPEERSLSSGTDASRRVTRTDLYPEAMLCFAEAGSDEIGFVLVGQPEEKLMANTAFKVGIDFGATGTNIFYKKGTDKPKPFTFQDRYVFVTAVSEERRARIYDNSLPAATERTPFLSIFKTFPNAPRQNLKPLLDGVIYFPRGGLFMDDDSITYNLKWSGRTDDTHKAEAFLKQLALQVAAEAVNAGVSQVGWAYSFPSAFSTTRTQAFRTTWTTVINACEKLTGVGLQADDQTNGPKAETESVAAALYFRDPDGHAASTATGAVCVDIGGSTSDIAIWQGGTLVWQTSLRLAGRDIFLNHLLSNPDVLGVLEQGLDISSLQTAKERGPIAFYAQVDAMLRQKGDDLLRSLSHSAETSEVRKLNRTIALGLSGIYYYVGLVVRHLADEKQSKYKKEIPKFYVGGNGSRMLNWLNLGNQFDSKTTANYIFRNAFLGASGLQSDTLVTETSRQPKAEAAYGLICGTQLSANGWESTKKVLAGESFLLGGESKGWEEMLSEDDFAKGIEAPPALDRLHDFLSQFNESAKRAEIPQVAAGESERKRLLQEVRIGLANALEDTRKGGEDGIQVEPIFILALKSLLKLTSGGY
jgi:hypothetical protein